MEQHIFLKCICRISENYITSLPNTWWKWKLCANWNPCNKQLWCVMRPSPIFNVDEGREMYFFFIFRCWMSHEHIPLRPDAAKCRTAIYALTMYKNCIIKSGHSQCEACPLPWPLRGWWLYCQYHFMLPKMTHIMWQCHMVSCNLPHIRKLELLEHGITFLQNNASHK